MIITIDGPAGGGKSTAARLLAQRLGIAFLDTGAMYRAITLRALRLGVDLRDERALERVAREALLRLHQADGALRVELDGQDVSEAIRAEAVSAASHHIASAGGVRGVLVDKQRQIAAQLGDVVTEGRDQGSVVFPDAEAKFYLTASVAERARRRYEQLRGQGEPADLDAIRDAIEQRDRRDESRDVGPLVKPADAVEIDTSDMTIEQVLDTLQASVEGRR